MKIRIRQKHLFYITWILVFLIHLVKIGRADHLENFSPSNPEPAETKSSILAKETDPLSGIPVTRERPYFLDREEGWFWYIDPAPPRKKKNPQPKKETPPQTFERIEPKNFKPYWPDFKTSREIQAYQKELLDSAVMDPTPEKVKKYIEFQQYIMSKSRLFTDVAQRVIWENPELDQQAKNPTAVIARTVSNQLRNEDVSRKMNQIAGIGGIVFFFSSTCPYCHLEGPILKRFEERYGIKVIAVSLDGGGLPEYPNPIIDQGAARALHIESTPTLFFGKPPKEMIRMANGMLSEKEIEDRLLSIMEEIQK